MLMKKRMVSVNPNEINNKISEHMRNKCESLGFKEHLLLNNKIILNKTPNQFKFVTRTERSNSKSPIKKMTFSYENQNNNYSNDNNNNFNNSQLNNDGYCLNLEEENSINNLSSRIEKYCNISKRYMKKNANNISNSKLNRILPCSSNKKNSFPHLDKKANQSKSPLNFYFEEKNKENHLTNDNFINYNGTENSNFNSIYDTANAPLNISTCGATSIRKMFDFENEKDKCKENNFNSKFKAKPLKQDIFSNNSPNHISNETETFNSILEKSRQDKFALDKLEKEKAKKAKISEIKTSKFGINKNSSSNSNGNINNKKKAAIGNNSNNNFQIKRNAINLNNKKKIVDFNELMLTED